MLNLRIKNVLAPMMMVLFLLISSSFAQDQTKIQTDTGKTKTTVPGYETKTQTQMQTQGSQMYKQNAERWTMSLSNKLNLTSDQQTRINSILMDYQTRRSQLGTTTNPKTLQDDVNRQIEGVLDNNQRTNWDAYSTNWWQEINGGTGQMNKTNPDNNSDYNDNSRYNEKSDTSRTSGDKDKR